MTVALPPATGISPTLVKRRFTPPNFANPVWMVASSMPSCNATPLAAIVVARELGVSDARIRSGLQNFEGVKRRFTKVGEWNGTAIIDDYGHNPFKIAAALKAARQAYKGPVVAVVQPHRYTRLRDTFDQFCTCLNDADVAIIAPVYAAGEQPIEGINRDSYAEALRAHGHRNVLTIDGEEELAAAVAPYLKPGGVVVGTGAGSITGWMHNLQKKLEGA
jgi:UDP-N-acetylmuramate--alanine ligase